MPNFRINTKYGSYNIESSREPTQLEADQIAYAYSKRKPQQQDVSAPEPSLVEQGLYMFLDTVPAVAAAIIGKRIGGRRVAAKAAALAGAGANFLKQYIQSEKGQRDEYSIGELASSAIYSIPTSGIAAPVTKKINNVILRNALTSAADGAIIATAGSAVESAFENGGLPDIANVSQAAALGFGMGGLTGGVLTKYAEDGMLIKNQAAALSAKAVVSAGSGYYTYEKLKEQGDPSAFSKAFLTTGVVFGLTGIPSKIAMTAGAGAKATNLLLGPERIVGREVTAAVRSADERLNASKFEADFLATKIKELIPEGSAGDEIAAQVLRANDTGQIDLAPVAFRPYLEKYKQLRIKNGSLIDEYYSPFADNPEVFSKKIQDQLATYQRRSYRAFERDAVNGVDYNTPEARAQFKKELIDGFIEELPGESSDFYANKAEAYMTRMLQEGTFFTSGIDEAAYRTSKASSALKKRGEPSLAARKFLGEVKNPGEVLAETLDAQSRLVVIAERDREIIKALEASGLASRNRSDVHTSLFNRPEKSMLHPALDGMWAKPEVIAALNEMFSPSILGSGPFVGGWLKLLGYSKASKTVLNPLESITPQIYGNFALSASAWKANPKYIFDSARRLMQVGFTKVPKKLTSEQQIKIAEELKEGISLGVLANNYDAQEIRTLLSAAGTESSLSKIVNKFSKVYSTPDALFRYSVWKANIDELISFERGRAITDDPIMMKAIKKKAADITNDQFPTYSRVSRRYRQMSAMGMANAFGAFEFEVFRNSYNQIKYATELIRTGAKEGNTAKIIAGTKRLVGFAAVTGTTAGIAKLGSEALGVSDDLQVKIKENLLPVYDKDKSSIIGVTGDGKITWAPVNYLLPFANAIGMINEIASGRNPAPAIKSSLLGTDWGPVITPAIETVNNTYYNTNVPISLPQSYTDLILRQLTQSFVPGTISGTLNRIMKANQGATSNLGTSYEMSDVWKRMIGFRNNTGDPLRLAEIRLKDTFTRAQEAQAGYRRVLNQAASRGDQAMSQINEQALYDRSNKIYIETQTELANIYETLKAFQATGKFKGITDEAIYKAFDGAGIPKSVFLGVATNSSMPMTRGLTQTSNDFNELLNSVKPNEQSALIKQRSIATGKPTYEIRTEFGEWKRSEAAFLKDPQKRVTQLLKNYGAKDGERAKVIFYILQGKDQQTQSSMISSIRRQGLLPYEVERDLRRLQREYQ